MIDFNKIYEENVSLKLSLETQDATNCKGQ